MIGMWGIHSMWIAAAGDDTVNGTYDGTRGGAGAARGIVKRALDDLWGLMGNHWVKDLGAKYTLDEKVGARADCSTDDIACGACRER